ncbi:hypothetical protein [Micromonospora orduensis]|uniref:hypothetical protein n=1 Tax=Micromonospora orduensis TaxID=1420891 RepID=UPI001ABFA83E|nr:hypothetical protein [Micromonospora orduensis]
MLATGWSSRTFDRSAAALDNPDHVDIVIAAKPTITVPSISLEGDANGAPHLDPSVYAKQFTGRYEHRTVGGGVGHNLPQEAPRAFAEAVLDVCAQR